MRTILAFQGEEYELKPIEDKEVIFTCRKCEANYEVGDLEQPVTECPVCFWRPKL